VSGAPARILVADDEENVAISIRAILEMDGHEVDVVYSGPHAIERIVATDYDVVLTDLRLGETSGQDVLAAVKRHHPSTVSVMLTGYASLESAVAALREGAYDYLIKPSDPEELRLTVNRAVERRQLQRALGDRVRQLEEANARIAQLNSDLERRVDDATAELRAAVERLQELDTLKSQFLSIASHELRTPITAVSGFAQLALRGLRERLAEDGGHGEAWSAELERLMRQLTIIHEQSSRLGRLVRELLDVSRIQSGRVDLRLEEIDLGDVVRAAVEQMQMAVPDRRFDLHVDHPAKVRADRDHLEQVIANLLDNAVKYSPESSAVAVRVSRERGEARCVVEDHGMGIAPEDLERVFELFFRTSAAETHRTPGIGLGLYISREIVQRHGGRIWAESSVGKGTRVHIALPAVAPKPARTQRPARRAEALVR
jgi:signal transduction histidine kinase